MKSPEQKRTNAQRMRERSVRLKQEGRCVRCGAGLQDGDDVTCLECREHNRAKSAARRAAYTVEQLERERASANASMKWSYAKYRERYLEQKRELRDMRRAARLCLACGADMAPQSNSKCQRHIDDDKRSSKRRRQAKRAVK